MSDEDDLAILRRIRDKRHGIPIAPLSGEWRYNNGYLICGTLRIAAQDFDTSPSVQRQKEIFDWIVYALNKQQGAATEVMEEG